MDFSKVVSIQIPEGNVTKLQDKDGNILWTNINKLAYGIRWSTNTGTTCERIGNLEFHKTLPIQSKFKVCVHQGTDIKYYCNPDDSRFRENPTILSKDDFEFDSCDGLPSGIVCCDEDSNIKYKVVNDIFVDYKYLYAYIYITSESANCVARIVYIDVTTKTAYLNDANQQDSTYATISGDINFIVGQGVDYYIELGAVINGYDGEVGIDTGAKFYQWSVDNAGVGNEVWISEYKCVPYAKEVKRHIIGCSRACVLNSAFNDIKWGWIGTLQANTSVNVINYNSKLRGGSNNSNWDKYLGIDNFRCQFNKGRTNMQLFVMRQYTQKLANHQVLYKQLWEAIVWCWCIEYAQLDVKKTFNSNLTTEGYHQGGLGAGYSVNGVDLGNYNNNECFTPCDYTLHLGNKTGIRTRAARQFSIVVAANHFWNYYNYSRVTATKDSTNKILTITKIATAYPNDWNIYVSATSVSGKHTYTITGLTDSQSIIFKTKNGNITVTEDGTYEIDWSNNNGNRLIAFTKSQAECNIVITIDSAPSSEVIQTQYKWNVPHWRGFNVFWYGDIWLNIENFLSKYDSTKQRRIYYWTDDITKFDNTIDNKEHSLEDIVAPQSNCINEFNLGNQGSLTPRSYGSGKNIYHYDNADSQIHTTFTGGRVGAGSFCGLACLNSTASVAWAGAHFGFATCTIID